MRIEWICSNGLGTNSGQGEVEIGVLERCCTECDTVTTQKHAHISMWNSLSTLSRTGHLHLGLLSKETSPLVASTLHHLHQERGFICILSCAISFLSEPIRVLSTLYIKMYAWHVVCSRMIRSRDCASRMLSVGNWTQEGTAGMSRMLRKGW